MSSATLLSRSAVARFVAVPKPPSRRTFVAVRAATPDESRRQPPSPLGDAPPKNPLGSIPTPTPNITSPPPFTPPPLDTRPGGGVSDLGNALSFAGPAPEAINGRLAMLGFVAAVGAELATHTPVLQQVALNPWAVGTTFVVLIAASLIPIISGTKLRESGGLWNPDAEIINGRLAMVGLVALVLTEVWKGSSLL